MDKYNHWLGKIVAVLKGWEQAAITLGQTTYYSCGQADVGAAWHAHENCHKQQFAREGWCRFLAKYAWWSLTKGYEANPFEVEAQQAAEKVTKADWDAFRQRIKQVKDANDLVEIVDRLVCLRMDGDKWIGPCPFADHSYPTFEIEPYRQRYHCHGCGKYGDVITFIQEHQHVSFREAVDVLAKRAGLERTEAVRGGKAQP